MSDKELADTICRLLLAIVAAIRKRYDLPIYHGITLVLQSEQIVATPPLAEFVVQCSHGEERAHA